MGNKQGSRGGGQALGTSNRDPNQIPKVVRATSSSRGPVRSASTEEERRKRAEAMEKKLAKQKNRGAKSTKSKAKDNWETYKKLDKVTKAKAAKNSKQIQNGVISRPSKDSGSARRNENIGPQSATFQTRA
mmetsp:Transcript_12441/g.14742  ORF Transcript_12441/g.14742 Transcript_12441/m.14742 type:complete len:131 (-) Transcript_12441:56-448(-)